MSHFVHGLHFAVYAFHYEYARLCGWRCYDQMPTFEASGCITSAAGSAVHLHCRLSAFEALAALWRFLFAILCKPQ